jgi:hypothetical protein
LRGLVFLFQKFGTDLSLLQLGFKFVVSCSSPIPVSSIAWISTFVWNSKCRKKVTVIHYTPSGGLALPDSFHLAVVSGAVGRRVLNHKLSIHLLYLLKFLDKLLHVY